MRKASDIPKLRTGELISFPPEPDAESTKFLIGEVLADRIKATIADDVKWVKVVYVDKDTVTLKFW